MSLTNRVFSFLKTILPSQIRVSASARLLGRHTSGAGGAEEIQLGNGFSMVGNTLTFENSATIGGMVIDLSITGLTGGEATKLDGVAITPDMVGQIRVVLINGSFYFYVLTVGDVAESLPRFVNVDSAPDSYYWALHGAYFVSLTAATIAATNGIHSNTSLSAGGAGEAGSLGLLVNVGDDLKGVTVSASDITDDRFMTLSDREGVLVALPPFENEAAAAGEGGVDIGDSYYDTTLKKARTRLV
jgi:hypothetical protein